MQQVCAACGGTGWKVTEREGLSAAERCDCTQRERTRWLEEQANIPPLYSKASIDNFVVPQDNPAARTGLGGALIAVRAYMREFPAGSKPGLLFIGKPGTGKTHLAVAVLRALIAKGFQGVFFDFQNLLDRIRSGYDKPSGTMDRQPYQTALDADVLVLDDLGAHRVTDWVEDTITSIVTFRCNNRKATVITTNLRDPEAGDQRGTGLHDDLQAKYFLEERIGMRARSRLFEMCKVIRMPNVEDYRLRKR